MPNEISNALGTARQFTPKPDATYQGRYRDMSVSQVHPAQSSWTTLADNMSKLNNALQSYAVSHEKYLDSTGLDRAQDLIKSQSPEDIEKLNVIDGAQSIGLLDAGSNPYFKAYAEKLRGNFLGARLKQNYDDEYANIPAKSANDELKRYNEYVQNYRKDLLEKAPPSNLEAFDRGFYENSLTNATNLVGAYNKKKNEEYVINTVADITNELGDILNEAPELLKDNSSFTKRVQQTFNASRLMGLPVQYRQKLINDFTQKCVEAGIFPFERLSQMMDNVVIQSDIAGNTKTMADFVDINSLKDMNMAYTLKYDQKKREDYIQKYGISKNSKGMLEAMEAVKYTDPREYKMMSQAYPAVKQKEEQVKAEEKALQRARLASANRSASGSGSSKKIQDSDLCNQAIGAWLNGDTIVSGYGTIRNMKFDDGVFTGCVMNQLQYMASNGNFAGCTKLMSMPQVNAIKSDLASQMGSSLAGIHLDSNGYAEYDDMAKYIVEWTIKDPAGAMYLFSGSDVNEAMVIAGLSSVMGGIDNAMQGYAIWNSKSPEEKNSLRKTLHTIQSTYSLEGLENMWSSDTTKNPAISVTSHPYLNSTWEVLSGIKYYTSSNGNYIKAMNSAGEEMSKNIYFYRQGVIPKYLTQNITGDGSDDRDLVCTALSLIAHAPNASDNFTVNYDWSGQRFTLTNVNTGAVYTASASWVRDVAGKVAEKIGRDNAQTHYENTQLTAEDINNSRISQALETPDSNYVGGEDTVSMGYQAIKQGVEWVEDEIKSGINRIFG